MAVALLAAPALAQETGPQGLAEPTTIPRKVILKAIEDAKKAALAEAPARTAENTLNFELSTGGIVSIQLRPDRAPLAVERLKTLTAQHFYDGLTFHRVIEGFMAQGGDPKGTGAGGSTLPDLKAEFNDLPHVRGALAMARAASEDSANSQFYIVLSPSLMLDTHYTVVGRVFQGMAYVDQLEKGEPPANPSRILKAYVGAPPATAALTPQEVASLEAVLPPRPVMNAAALNAPATLADSAPLGTTVKPATAKPAAKPRPKK